MVVSYRSRSSDERLRVSAAATRAPCNRHNGACLYAGVQVGTCELIVALALGATPEGVAAMQASAVRARRRCSHVCLVGWGQCHRRTLKFLLYWLLQMCPAWWCLCVCPSYGPVSQVYFVFVFVRTRHLCPPSSTLASLAGVRP